MLVNSPFRYGVRLQLSGEIICHGRIPNERPKKKNQIVVFGSADEALPWGVSEESFLATCENARALKIARTLAAAS
jgi:hypothetical protein